MASTASYKHMLSLFYQYKVLIKSCWAFKSINFTNKKDEIQNILWKIENSG